MKTSSVNILVNALRSGKYKKGDYELIRERMDSEGNTYKEYCCLGVAKEIFNLKEVCFSTLGSTYRDLGIYSPGGSLRIDAKFDASLYRLNDTGYQDAEGGFIFDPLTFDEIADVILISHWEGWLGPKGVGV